MKRLQCIIKVTDGCNLRCKYCYNAKKQFKNTIVSLESIERFFTLLEGIDALRITFHGGEPMLAGMEFYEKVLELEKRFTMISHIEFENQIQTNATLVDRRWISFFKKCKMGVGISFDGMYNDIYRGETEKVLRAMALMKRNELKFGCLSVVADPDYDIIGNYEYLKSFGAGIDFNYVFMEGNAKSLNKIIDIESYTQQMIALFDRWIYDLDGISVRGFDFIIKTVLGCGNTYCRNGSCIGNFFCLDVDGTLYGCGRESVKKYPFGNVNELSRFHDIINSENFKLYIKGAIARRNDCSTHCPYFNYCKGGCNDDAILAGDLTRPNQEYCYYFGTLFSHVKEKVDKIFADKVDLSTLNPHFTKALMQTTAIDETGKI